MLSETIRVSRIVALAHIPNVLWMATPVWIRLDSVVGVPSHEEPIERATLAVCKLVVSIPVLRVKHSLLSQVSLDWLHHSWVWLQVWSIIPGIAATEVAVGHSQ